MSLADFERVDATAFNLTKRTALYSCDENSYAFIVSRKSRFIMKDAQKLVDRAKQVKEIAGTTPSLIISAPLCSKAKTFITESGINITKIGEA
jgi:hypothetical protein